MSAEEHPLTRHQRRETERQAARNTPRRSSTEVAEAERRSRRLRGGAFAVIVVVVLGVGLYLAGGVFLGQRDATTVASAMPLRVSMAGFEPKVIHAKVGESMTFDWWNSDGAMHLSGGVHTLVSDALGIRLELPAESRKTVTITVPLTAGDYDFWCDSCCGGKENEKMHGTLHVEA